MDNLKSNIIKAIFPDEYINHPNLSDELVEKYYKTDNVYLNSFQIHDQLANINGCHGFSKNIRKENESSIKRLYMQTPSINYSYDYTNPLIKLTNIDSISLDEINTYYHKLIMAKDINWENAYLRYAPISYQNVNQPLTYFDIDPDTGEKVVLYTDPNTGKQITDGVNYSYMYYTNIPTYINNTYELLTIIDYLFVKIKSLKFLLENVKSQHSNIEIYKLKENISNNS